MKKNILLATILLILLIGFEIFLYNILKIKNLAWYEVLSFFFTIGVMLCAMASLKWINQRKEFFKIINKFREDSYDLDHIKNDQESFGDSVIFIKNKLDSISKGYDTSEVYFIYYYEKVFKNLLSSRSIESANSIAKNIIDVRQYRFDILMIMPRYIVWLIPSVGFIGTIFAISSGFDVLSVSFSSNDIKTMGDFFGEFSIAFETTLVALSFTAVLYLLISFLENKAYSTLFHYLEFFEEDVFPILPNPETTDFKLALESIAKTFQEASLSLNETSSKLNLASSSILKHQPTVVQSDTLSKIDEISSALEDLKKESELTNFHINYIVEKTNNTNKTLENINSNSKLTDNNINSLSKEVKHSKKLLFEYNEYINKIKETIEVIKDNNNKSDIKLISLMEKYEKKFSKITNKLDVLDKDLNDNQELIKELITNLPNLKRELLRGLAIIQERGVHGFAEFLDEQNVS